MNKSLYCYVLMLFVFFSPSLAFGGNSDQTHYSEFIPVLAENTIVSDVGIYVLMPLVDGNLKKMHVSHLSCGESGLAVVEASFSPEDIPLLMRCPKNHVSTCSKCFGCSNSSCPHRCRCSG